MDILPSQVTTLTHQVEVLTKQLMEVKQDLMLATKQYDQEQKLSSYKDMLIHKLRAQLQQQQQQQHQIAAVPAGYFATTFEERNAARKASVGLVDVPNYAELVTGNQTHSKSLYVWYINV